MVSTNTSKKRKEPTSASAQRQNRVPPNEDIKCVASPYDVDGIVTSVVSNEMKDVLLDRLATEILSKITGGWCRTTSDVRPRRSKKQKLEHCDNVDDGTKGQPMSIAEKIVRTRLVVGINQCTNVLQRRKENQSTASNGSVKETNPLPSLIILTRDIRPANIMAHIPFYAHLLQIPTLILPGKSSVELGQALGIRSAAVAMFLPSDNSTSIDDSLKEEWKETHEDVDSFVKYVISKIPK
eukprot:g5542.t1 g5542   contig2:744601-745412(-)